MRTFLLLFFSLLSQMLFAQNAAVPTTEKFDSAFVFSIIKGKTDTVEAIFKWVADNISYDMPRRNDESRGGQTVAQTFYTRKGVCEDYTNLINAFYKKAGYQVEKITGYTIDDLGIVDTIEGHAWTAIKDRGQWYLLDATWASGGVAFDIFVKEYNAKWYKMPPPEFLKTHIPHDPIWRLGNRQRHQEIVEITQKQDSIAILKSLMVRMESCDDVQKSNPLQKEAYQYIKRNLEVESHNNGLDLIEKKLEHTILQFHKQFGWYEFLDKKPLPKLTDDELKALQKEMNLTWNQANRLFLKLPNKPTDYIKYNQERVTLINTHLRKYFAATKN
jgi:Transglutaminase-like superfamily